MEYSILKPMPITAQALKKMRHDKTVESRNRLVRENVRLATKTVRKSPNATTLQKAFTLLDKAAKRHIIHPNKASRLKSRLSKLLAVTK
jgi:small subunit ribosomal protein S20